MAAGRWGGRGSCRARSAGAPPSPSSHFRGNGPPDLATANTGGNTVRVLLGQGGSFHSTGHNGAVTDPLSLAVGDFNGDGEQDLAPANSGSAAVAVGPLPPGASGGGAAGGARVGSLR